MPANDPVTIDDRRSAREVAMIRRLAAYNAWANLRLYAACATLSPHEHHATRPAFFGSIHGTLNHLLVTDRIWMARLSGEPVPPYRLDQEICATLDALSAARVAEDRRITAYVEDLGTDDLARDLVYRRVGGEACRDPVDAILQHLFNHQTHHRGQVHDMLSQTAVPPPSLDLILFTRASTAAS